jgi:hypothetical protein
MTTETKKKRRAYGSGTLFRKKKNGVEVGPLYTQIKNPETGKRELYCLNTEDRSIAARKLARLRADLNAGAVTSTLKAQAAAPDTVGTA